MDEGDIGGDLEALIQEVERLREYVMSLRRLGYVQTHLTP